MRVDEFLLTDEIITNEDVSKFAFLIPESKTVINNSFKLNQGERRMFYDNHEDIHTAVDYVLTKNKKLLQAVYDDLSLEIPVDYVEKITRKRTGTEQTDNTGTQTNGTVYGKTETKTLADERVVNTPAGETETITPAGKTTTFTPNQKTTTTTPAGETTEEQGTITKTNTHSTKAPFDSNDFVEDEKNVDVEQPANRKSVKTFQGNESVVESYVGNESTVETYQGNESHVKSYQGNNTTTTSFINDEVLRHGGSDTLTRTDLLKQLLTLNTTETEEKENGNELIDLISKIWNLYETNLLEMIINLIKENILSQVWECSYWDL